MAAKNERALIELFAPAAPEALGSTASARFEEITLRPAGAWLHFSRMDGIDIKIGRAARRRESCSAASASEAFDRASQN